jgi:hypothetical protein
MTLKQKLNELIASGRLDKAIELLMEKTSNTEQDIHNTLILLKSRFSSNERDNNMGILSRSDYQRTNNQLIYSFQQTISNVPKELMEMDLDAVPSPSGSVDSFKLNEKEGKIELLDALNKKKLFLEKELIVTYDSEKKFALQEQMKELEKQIDRHMKLL